MNSEYVKLNEPHLPLLYFHKSHDREKRRVYEQRVREVERASFTPLVFS